ncbi:glutamine amidotransferase [Kocuria sp.]|uniref:glutamine amidotransferase n=1 Tax=Kocuria sp. TaxID=1871328 RepID=UPI0026E0C3AB|nr:glutamine amidotransferase [Kocuria sp.]MDO5618494.1 glutamine amidotransferase [Kocuria sp.]
MIAVAIRHVAFEDLGSLETVLGKRGYAVRYLDAGVDPLEPHTVMDADLLVVLGGPVGAYDMDSYPFLVQERSVLAARLSANRPTLGICLGAQLMAHALGAEVTAAPHQEIGYAPVDLTEEGSESVLAQLQETPVLHWHGDQFEIPLGATRLAETRGFPNQAFQLGPNVLGLQFHLEADYRRIEQWLIGHAVELSGAGVPPEVIRYEAAHHGPALERAMQATVNAWLDGLQR